MAATVNFKHISAHEVPERSPGFLLWHVSTAWRTAIEAVLKPLQLTHPQFVVLATLGWLTKDGKHITQATLGNMAGLDPNTLSQILRGLEKNELVQRITSLDARAKNPFLTTIGSQLLMKALPAVEKADADFFSTLSTQESADMLIIFQKLSLLR